LDKIFIFTFRKNHTSSCPVYPIFSDLIRRNFDLQNKKFIGIDRISIPDQGQEQMIFSLKYGAVKDRLKNDYLKLNI